MLYPLKHIFGLLTFVTLLCMSCFKPKTATCPPKIYPEDTHSVANTFFVIRDKHWFADSVIINGVDVTQSVLDDVGGSYEFYLYPSNVASQASALGEEDLAAEGYFYTPKYNYYDIRIEHTKCPLTALYTYSDWSQPGTPAKYEFITWLPNYMDFGSSNYSTSKLGKSSTYSSKFMSVTKERIKLQLQMPDTTINWILKVK
jgi:hypothetical protein